MGFEVICGCGTVLPVTEGMAGSAITCRCGKWVNVPLLSEVRGEAFTAEPAQPDAAPGPSVARNELG